MLRRSKSPNGVETKVAIFTKPATLRVDWFYTNEHGWLLDPVIETFAPTD